MNPKPLRLLLAVLTLASSVPPVRAQDYSEKDKAKAEKLAAEDKDFKALPDDEKEAVIIFIAREIHGRRRKAIGASITNLKGADVDTLKKRANKSHVVVAEQDKEAVNVPEGPSTIEVKSIDTPSFGRLFKDNEWTVDEGSSEAAQLKQNIDNVVDTLKKTGGKLVSMHVESSASTLRNTGKAAKMTHLELSKARAEAAARYALEYLKSKGYTLDEEEQVTLDFEGSNKNGTSGPTSPFAVPEGDDAKFNPQGCCKPPEEAVKIAANYNKASAEDKAKLAKFYDDFKYVQLTFDAMFETKSSTPGVKTPGEAHIVSAYVSYKSKPQIRIPRIRLPRIRIGWPFGNKERRMARRAVRCPKW